MAAWLRQWRHPVLDQRQGWQVQVRGRLRTRLASRDLPVGEGDPLQVDGSFHGLKQEVPLFGIKFKTPLTGVTPPPGLEGEGGLKERHRSD